MTRISAMLVLPRTSISWTSLALSSSRATSTCWRRYSTGSGLAAAALPDLAESALTVLGLLAFFAGGDLVFELVFAAVAKRQNPRVRMRVTRAIPARLQFQYRPIFMARQ